MKYIAIWIGVFAAVILLAGAAWLIYTAANWITTDPSRQWVVVLIVAAILIAAVFAVVEYLTDQPRKPRNPKAPPNG